MIQPPITDIELSERVDAVHCGGIVLIIELIKKLNVVALLNKHVSVLKQHKPYYESDHILTIAFNLIMGGQVLEDLNLRRQDSAIRRALGMVRIPDPTTLGDFCRRFVDDRIEGFWKAIRQIRALAWRLQPESFFERATIDLDGLMTGLYLLLSVMSMFSYIQSSNARFS